jgi:hypothetical protein
VVAVAPSTSRLADAVQRKEHPECRDRISTDLGKVVVRLEQVGVALATLSPVLADGALSPAGWTLVGVDKNG